MTHLLLLASLTAPALGAPAPAPPAPAEAAPATPEKLFRKRSRLDQHLAVISLSGGLASEVSVEVTGEVNLPLQHSVAVIAGVGAWQAFGSGVLEQLHVNAGAQYRYTLLGDFETGVYVGFEPLARIQPRQAGVPWQLSLSGLGGFKYTTPIDLVVDLSAGPGVVVGNFGAPRATGVVNVQVGYAFGKKPYK